MSNSTIIRTPTTTKLGQAIFTELTAANAQTITTLTWTTITDGTTNMSVVITPTLNTSNILLFIDYAGSCSTPSMWKITRNGSDVGVGTGATGSQKNSSGGLIGLAAANPAYGNFRRVYLDSPASTSAQTYTIQLWNSGGCTLWVNRSGTDTNSTTCYRYTTRLIAIEVLA